MLLPTLKDISNQSILVYLTFSIDYAMLCCKLCSKLSYVSYERNKFFLNEWPRINLWD